MLGEKMVRENSFSLFYLKLVFILKKIYYGDNKEDKGEEDNTN